MKHKLPYLTLVLIVLTVLLPVVIGLLSSAISISEPLRSFAPLLLACVTFVLCVVVAVQYLREKQIQVQVSEGVDRSDGHNRKVFLNWIGIYYAERLKESFEGAAPIVPGLLLTSLYQDTRDHSGKYQQELPQPAGTTIVQVYDRKETRGDLLILGKPGAGKTTLLFTLAVALHARAELTPLAPIPIIVNLSNWAKRKRSLLFEEWFIKEASRRYNMPPKLIRRWLEADQLLLLLDGLDEVPSYTYDACIKAINDFRQKNFSFIPLVICSRYEADFKQMQYPALQSAVIILPLEEQQIEEYCKAAGVDQVLQDNAELRELMRLPFILHIVISNYQDTSIRHTLQKEVPEKLRLEIFDRYLQRMLAHQQGTSSWPVTQTKDWLVWIAWHLQKDKKSDFTLEDFTPAWLPKTQRLFYQVLTWLIALPVATLIVVPVFRQGSILLQSLQNSASSCSGLSCFWSDDVVGTFFANIGLVVGGWLSNSFVTIILEILCVVGLGGFFAESYNRVAVAFTPSGKRVLRDAWKKLDWWSIDASLESVKTIVGSVCLLILPGLILGSVFVVSLAWHIVIGLIITLLFLLVFIISLYFFSFIVHLLFWRSGCLPWNLSSFLDENVRHLLLYKENSRYRFIHNLFRDHLASLAESDL